MNLDKIQFPLYKLRKFTSVDKNPLGLIKVLTVTGEYILDDLAIDGTFEQRRVILKTKYPREKIYNLKEQILYLRQLVKYKSGTHFIDNNGQLIKYLKSSKLFDITSHKILRKRNYENWTIIYLDGIEFPFIVGKILSVNSKFASLMNTKWGPFLYDITSVSHEPYKRKI